MALTIINSLSRELHQQIAAYENGQLDEDEIDELFQVLVNSGLAWQLQGHFGRTAVELMKAGRILPKHLSERSHRDNRTL